MLIFSCVLASQGRLSYKRKLTASLLYFTDRQLKRKIITFIASYNISNNDEKNFIPSYHYPLRP